HQFDIERGRSRLSLSLDKGMNLLHKVVDRCRFTEVDVDLPLASQRVAEFLQIIRRARVKESKLMVSVVCTEREGEWWDRYKHYLTAYVAIFNNRWVFDGPEEYMSEAQLLQLAKDLIKLKVTNVTWYDTTVKEAILIGRERMGLRPNFFDDPPKDLSTTRAKRIRMTMKDKYVMFSLFKTEKLL
ncbi:hypothetical protein PENTCL1PPCAC_1301, partial [Pristionchus entomophagus]